MRVRVRVRVRAKVRVSLRPKTTQTCVLLEILHFFEAIARQKGSGRKD
jgi:hypothetical protein